MYEKILEHELKCTYYRFLVDYDSFVIFFQKKKIYHRNYGERGQWEYYLVKQSRDSIKYNTDMLDHENSSLDFFVS